MSLVCMDYHHDAMVVCFYARPEIQPNAVPDATSVKVHAYVSRAVQQTGNPVVQRAVALMLQTFQHKMAIPHAARWSSRLSRGTHSQGVLGTVPRTLTESIFAFLDNIRIMNTKISELQHWDIDDRTEKSPQHPATSSARPCHTQPSSPDADANSLSLDALSLSPIASHTTHVPPSFDRATISPRFQITPALDFILEGFGADKSVVVGAALVLNNPRLLGDVCVRELMAECGISEEKATLFAFYGGRL
ncbi:hypothetical protein BOTBODRAFT_180890 [Botryobasidium botryosum FD-172 SS1]|uniref:Uncharacterized protein n=1 Tax=Botryobasidium botryosum (strain FD-172 SS1) TaxID=930990 RepID=A0A067M5S5_BOTB1|nr:hypothetical protein BOTBODRAFT_180890 [Botryobasidium botryosum FD-172 SS1]